MTDLTSRGVPALFKIFTTACTPFDSSNARRAGGESTRMHSKVSRVIDDRGGEVFPRGLFEPEPVVPVDI